MASEDRRQAPDLKSKLLRESRRYSFVQAMRLLRGLIQRETAGCPEDQVFRQQIRVRPDLSLVFPETDLLSIQESPDEPLHFRITATFLGLYGAASPLPTFYTEDLLRERLEDRSTTRDFIDIINAPLYPLHFRIWGKYRLFYKLVEEVCPGTLQRLFCLLGLPSEAFQESVHRPYRLLRFLGLFTQFPRSAEGLRALLADHLAEPTIDIVQCVPRRAGIPPDQRLRLGQAANVLGEDSHLGHEIADCQGKFRIQLGPLDSERYQRFLPDQETYRETAAMVALYLDQPLLWDLELVLAPGQAHPTELGGSRWSRLGWDTWLLPPGRPAARLVARLWGPEAWRGTA